MLPGNAGIPGVTVSGSEQGFWVKAVRKPAGLLVMPPPVADWSSSERSNGVAWYQRFSGGGQDYHYQARTYSVRAVRAF